MMTIEGFQFDETDAENFRRALRAVVREREVSAGAVHRALRCGYSCACILIEQMRAEGFIVRNSYGEDVVVEYKADIFLKKGKVSGRA